MTCKIYKQNLTKAYQYVQKVFYLLVYNKHLYLYAMYHNL